MKVGSKDHKYEILSVGAAELKCTSCYKSTRGKILLSPKNDVMSSRNNNCHYFFFFLNTAVNPHPSSHQENNTLLNFTETVLFYLNDFIYCTFSNNKYLS